MKNYRNTPSVRVTRDGDTLTAKVGRLSISVMSSTPAEKLIARRTIARADLSTREPNDETGPGGFRRSDASYKIEAALTALLAEI